MTKQRVIPSTVAQMDEGEPQVTKQPKGLAIIWMNGGEDSLGFCPKIPPKRSMIPLLTIHEKSVKTQKVGMELERLGPTIPITIDVTCESLTEGFTLFSE